MTFRNSRRVEKKGGYKQRVKRAVFGRVFQLECFWKRLVFNSNFQILAWDASRLIPFFGLSFHFLQRSSSTSPPPLLLSSPSASRVASSTWPATGSRCWAQPSWCTGASRSRASSTPGRTRRTDATACCFAPSKRAWKPNILPPSDGADGRGGEGPRVLAFASSTPSLKQ